MKVIIKKQHKQFMYKVVFYGTIYNLKKWILGKYPTTEEW